MKFCEIFNILNEDNNTSQDTITSSNNIQQPPKPDEPKEKNINVKSPEEQEEHEKKKAEKKENKLKEKLDKEELEKHTNKLIETFNKENNTTSFIELKMVKNEYNKIQPGITLDITTDPYINNEKYSDGKIIMRKNLKLNEIFYKDIEHLAKEIGIKNITWNIVDDKIIGTVSL